MLYTLANIFSHVWMVSYLLLLFFLGFFLCQYFFIHVWMFSVVFLLFLFVFYALHPSQYFLQSCLDVFLSSLVNATQCHAQRHNRVPLLDSNKILAESHTKSFTCVYLIKMVYILKNFILIKLNFQ